MEQTRLLNEIRALHDKVNEQIAEIRQLEKKTDFLNHQNKQLSLENQAQKQKAFEMEKEFNNQKLILLSLNKKEMEQEMESTV